MVIRAEIRVLLFYEALKAFRPSTLLYRISKADVWSVIPAFPVNSPPIPRARPPKPKTDPPPPPPPPKRGKGKSRSPPQPKVKKSPPEPPPLVPKPTPSQLLSPLARDRALLSYIIKYTQDYTVRQLDYCGIARRVKGRGADVYVLDLPTGAHRK
ncbi:hypothetical protein R3P38DRAFT_3202916 [Favolaschia claudopus]|uniref:Uncharacterized protein n=1 Tax=Favolaschia claudopus TaxID=2862362 RepID=A0AAW0AVE4_9AGAR